ncbi:MAG: WD40 repeat domain-containing protein, partial [Anaerolineales bacterium]
MKKTSMITALVLVVGWASISGCRANTSTLVSPTPSISPTMLTPTPTRKPATPTFTLTPSPTIDLLPLDTWAGLVPEGAYARFFKGWLSDMAVSADGKRLALAGSLGVYVYATDTFQIKWNAATSEALSSADFSPDGTLLAAGSLDGGKIYLWDAETGTLVRKFMHGTDAIKVAFSPNGQTLAIKSWMEDYIVL